MAVYNFLNEDSSRIFFGDGLGSNVFTYESRKDLTRRQIGGIGTQEDYLKNESAEIINSYLPSFSSI